MLISTTLILVIMNFVKAKAKLETKEFRDICLTSSATTILYARNSVGRRLERGEEI